MIQEYRKASAEALGYEQINHTGQGICVKGDSVIKWNEWHPNTNLNQMGMILKHVLKSGWQVYMFAEENGEYWVRFKCVDKETIQHFSDTLEKAFMKAFMEWQRKEEG